MDFGSSQDFIMHEILNNADIFGRQNMAHLEKVPATGAAHSSADIDRNRGQEDPPGSWHCCLDPVAR
jgi:hypothetical protein